MKRIFLGLVTIWFLCGFTFGYKTNLLTGKQDLVTIGVAASDLSLGALANGITATTQTHGDNSNDVATDAFVIANAGGGGSMTWPGAAGIANYAGSSTWGTSYSATNLIPANFISTLNQNTTGTSGGLTGTPNISVGTIGASGKITTETSGTSNAPVNIPPGSAPTSPVNGDLWTTSLGVYAQVAGSTVGPFASGGGGMVYPGAGVANSTGSAWGTSYSATTTATASALAQRDANGNLSSVNYIQGYTTTATAGTTTTLTVSSTYLQFFTGSSNQTVQMPVTSTLVLGQQWLIVNNSTGTITVNSSGSNGIITVIAGSQVQLTCILITGTTAASWLAEYVGATATTGTGSIVYSNSPSLTTPALGTPSAAVLTNASGTAASLTAGLTTKLATARTINSVSFDGSANIQTATANTSDYTASTFTPGITFGGGNTGITYSVQIGRYTTIGNRVFFSIYVALSAVGSSTGTMLVTGLPTATHNLTNDYHSFVGYASGMAAGITSPIVFYTGPNSTTLTPVKMVTGTETALTNADCTATTNFIISGEYEI